MKTAILCIYMSWLVILQIQADVQENDFAELCNQCKGNALPRCATADDARLRKRVECKSEGCTIAMATDAETDYICLMDDESQKSVMTKQKDNGPQRTTLPVPLALQMVPTTESSKVDAPASTDPTHTIEIIGTGAENVSVAGQEEQKDNVPAKTESEETINKKENGQSAENEEKSAEEVDASKPTGEKIKPEQANNSDKAESVEVSAEKGTAEIDLAAPILPPPIAKPEIIPNSADYPADAPAMEVATSNEEEEQPHTADGNESAKVDHNVAESSKQQQNASENSGEGKQMLSAEKGEVRPNSAEQDDMNEGGHDTSVAENDNTAQVSEGEVDKPIHNAGTPVGPEPIGTLAPAPTPAAALGADQFLTCYSCSSTTDTGCAAGPGNAVNCKAMEDKQNGCYTLYKADTNVTTRGCISELTEDGIKYCMSNSKKCILCYEKGCNNLLAPSSAIRSNAMLSFWLGIASFVCFTFLV
ncbi:microtubule-associated protein futsch [Rhagoletis pomonella]|uniref:microtubule-associated protein futsch n=1 Tax=Rhagoletis pomonella TaxID=28610 RepID=UPI00177D8EE3|nr:microtubule-associated protein futsch [Rhagoletis pomonella]